MATDVNVRLSRTFFWEGISIQYNEALETSTACLPYILEKYRQAFRSPLFAPFTSKYTK